MRVMDHHLTREKIYRQNFSQPPSGIEFIDSSDFPQNIPTSLVSAFYLSRCHQCLLDQPN